MEHPTIEGAIAVSVAAITLPLLVAILLSRRWRLPWGLFGAGALAFPLSKLVQLPLAAGLTALMTRWELHASVQLAVILTLAPLCEESARWIAFRWWARGATSWREGVFVGVGHGGIEAMILGALVLAGLLGALEVPVGSPDAVAAQALLAAPTSLRLLGLLERVSAMLAHSGMSLLVMWSVRQRRPALLLASMALHFVFNAGGVLAAQHFGAVAAEAAFLIGAAGMLAIVLVARSREARAKPAATGPEPDRSAAISSRELRRVFGTTVALGGVTFDVPRGELFALLGPNGAGKTTMVRILSALISKSSGSAAVAGHVLGEDDDELRAHVGLLTETPGLYENLSAQTNLRIFGRLAGVADDALDPRIEVLLRQFELWERRDEPVSTFSKGMRQKVAIARALLHEPPVLFLDEPTSGLDPIAARELNELISSLKEKGHTILLTTHRLVEAEALADRIGILRGELIALDTVDGLRRRLFDRRMRVRLKDADEAMIAIVNGVDGVSGARWEDGQLLATLDDPELRIPEVVSALVRAGAAILAVEEVKESLEDVYAELVGEEERDVAA